MPGRPRHRADELHRDDRRRPRLCAPHRSAHLGQPRTRRHRRRQLGGALFGAMPAGAEPHRPPSSAPRAASRSAPRSSPPPPRSPPCSSWHRCSGCLPNATLAAVVIFYSVGLIKLAEFRALRRRARDGVPLGPRSPVGVLLFGTLKGIVVAIIVSMIGLASQTARPACPVIVRKRGADVLRPRRPSTPTTKPSRACSSSGLRGASSS